MNILKTLNAKTGVTNVGLGDKVTIYIPSTVNVNEKIDTKKYVLDCARMLSSMFGGATCINSTGFYVADSGELVQEDITQVYAYSSDITEEHSEKITDFIYAMKDELSQECISLEINGRLYFV